MNILFLISPIGRRESILEDNMYLVVIPKGFCNKLLPPMKYEKAKEKVEEYNKNIKFCFWKKAYMVKVADVLQILYRKYSKFDI
jgi:hypothetical protein